MSKQLIFKELCNQILLPLSPYIDTAGRGPTVCGALLTKKCNSRCSICHYWKQTDFSDEMTSLMWFDAFDQLWDLGVRMINFSADGEALVRNDCIEIMKGARDRGFDITLNTNGLALGRHIDSLLSLDPMQLQISLDALDDDVYFQVRGIKGGATIVRDNISILKQRGYGKISIGSVLTRENLVQLPLVKSYCDESGLIFRVTAFQFSGYANDAERRKQSYRDRNFILKLKEVVSKLLGEGRNLNNSPYYLNNISRYFLLDKFHPLDCKVPYYKVFILPDGRVSLCNVMHDSAVAGSLKSNTLREIWFGKDARRIRKDIRDRRCPSCWLSCFAEDNMRFSVPHMLKNYLYFAAKAFRMLKGR